jgi:hypothetical protein
MVRARLVSVSAVPVVVSFTSVVFPGRLPELYPEAEVKSVFEPLKVSLVPADAVRPALPSRAEISRLKHRFAFH